MKGKILINDLESYINKMPSLPVTMTKVLEICNDPKTSPVDLNKVISLDPVLMGNIMKLINSAYYGVSSEITSLVRAIIMLGLNTVKNLALTTSVLGSLKDSKNYQVFDLNDFWQHSLCVGVTSKFIAQKRKINPKILEEYFIAGLLHDVGKIPLNHQIADAYSEVISIAERDMVSLHTTETEELELSHSDVGGIIAKNWKLSPEIFDSIVYHHNASSYQGNHKDILFSVVLANYFANVNSFGYSGDRFSDVVPDHVYKELGLVPEFLEDITGDVKREIDKAKVFLAFAGDK